MDNSAYSSSDNRNEDDRKEEGASQVTKIDDDKKNSSYFNASQVDTKSSHIDMTKVSEPALKPYSGMGKDDLLRFSQTPFWNRLRMIFLVKKCSKFISI